MAAAPSPRRRGFSPIELLVVVVVIGLILALLIPAIRNAQEAARRTQCANCLRQLGQAIHNYLDLHKQFPPGYVSAESGGREVGPGWGWSPQMLGQLEQSLTFDAINFDQPVQAASNRTVRAVSLVVMLCPNSADRSAVVVRDPSGAVTVSGLPPASYIGSSGTNGTNGFFVRNTGFAPEDVADGMGQTLVFGERSQRISDATWAGAPPGVQLCTKPGWPARDCRPSWALVLGRAGDRPNDPASAADGFGSLHPGGAQFTLGDGSVRFVPDTIEPGIFRALATRSGGEMVNPNLD